MKIVETSVKFKLHLIDPIDLLISLDSMYTFIFDDGNLIRYTTKKFEGVINEIYSNGTQEQLFQIKQFVEDEKVIAWVNKRQSDFLTPRIDGVSTSDKKLKPHFTLWNHLEQKFPFIETNIKRIPIKDVKPGNKVETRSGVQGIYTGRLYCLVSSHKGVNSGILNKVTEISPYDVVIKHGLIRNTGEYIDLQPGLDIVTILDDCEQDSFKLCDVVNNANEVNRRYVLSSEIFHLCKVEKFTVESIAKQVKIEKFKFDNSAIQNGKYFRIDESENFYIMSSRRNWSSQDGLRSMFMIDRNMFAKKLELYVLCQVDDFDPEGKEMVKMFINHNGKRLYIS